MENLSKKSFTKSRLDISKSTLKAVACNLKGNKWKKIQYMLWMQKDELFWSVNIKTHLNSFQTTIDLGVKPLVIDTILWNIMDIKGNHELPTSFRSIGAFTCTAYPLDSVTFDNDIDNENLVEDIVCWVVDRTFEIDSLFSSLYRNHPNHVARGAYAIPLVCSLISENKLSEAIDVAYDFEKGSKSTVFRMYNWLQLSKLTLA